MICDENPTFTCTLGLLLQLCCFTWSFLEGNNFFYKKRLKLIQKCILFRTSITRPKQGVIVSPNNKRRNPIL